MFDEKRLIRACYVAAVAAVVLPILVTGGQATAMWAPWFMVAGMLTGVALVLPGHQASQVDAETWNIAVRVVGGIAVIAGVAGGVTQTAIAFSAISIALGMLAIAASFGVLEAFLETDGADSEA